MSSTQISTIFFVVGMVAITPVLYYHYRKHPHPRFRPPIGEMVMLSLLAVMAIGGGSYVMGKLLPSNPELHDTGPKQPGTNRAQPQDEQRQGGGGGGSSKKENRTPFGF